MARIRQIKPEFFKSEDIAGLEWPARMLFVGLWTLAAADGRLLDRPRRFAAELFPYDHMEDQIGILLGMLAARGLIARYVVDGKSCIQIVNFTKHQKTHFKEPESGLPPPPTSDHVGQSPGIAGQAQAKPVEPQISRSGSLGSGSLGSGSKPPVRDLWAADRWFQLFKLAWRDAKGTISYGQGDDDARATGDFTDKLASIPDKERLVAQGRAAEMFAAYFAIPEAQSAAHPWKWFVQRFNQFRVPNARGSPGGRGKPAVQYRDLKRP